MSAVFGKVRPVFPFVGNDSFQKLRGICLCSLLKNKDKYSLKNIGAKRKPQPWGRQRSQAVKNNGGNKKRLSVAMFQLPKQRNDEFESENESRHKAMIECALKIAIESVLCAGGSGNVFHSYPIEITKVDLSSNFSSAFVFWRCEEIENGTKQEEIKDVLENNIELIQNLLPAHHSMTHTPQVNFVQDLKTHRETEIEELFSKLKQEQGEQIDSF